MKKCTCFLLAALLLLSACEQETSFSGSASSFGNDSSLYEGSAELEDIVKVSEVADINFDWREEPDDTWWEVEYAVVSGLDETGAVQWTYESEKFPETELQQVEEIGLRGDCYYFNEGGTITTLDWQTGDIVWKNDGFGGVSISSVFCDNGTLLVCGFYGPDFYAIDSSGKTLKRIESFDDNYWWACGIERSGDQAIVKMAGGPDGYYEDGYRFYVDLQDWSFGRID